MKKNITESNVKLYLEHKNIKEIVLCDNVSKRKIILSYSGYISLLKAMKKLENKIIKYVMSTKLR